MAKDTLSSIAAKCGCSISTVSRVLNGNARKFRISETTTRRIREEVEASGYVPSALAKGLRTGKTGIVGLLVPSVGDVFFSSITSVIIAEARAIGYTVMIVDTQGNHKSELDSFNSLLSQNVEGIIAIPCNNGEVLSKRAEEYSVPIVFMDRYKGDTQGKTCIEVDNYAGAVMAVEHLINNGHKKILCIQGDPGTNTSSERVRGYLDTLEKHGLSQHSRIIGTDFSIEGGYTSAMEGLGGNDRPSAIFALSGNLMHGVLKAVKELHLNVPDELSLMSFDDNPIYDCIIPGISCIDQPVSRMGSIAVRALKEAIEGRTKMGHISIRPDIIERESVRNIVSIRRSTY